MSNQPIFAPDDTLIANASAPNGLSSVIRISGLHAKTLAKQSGIPIPKPWHINKSHWIINKTRIPCHILFAQAPNSFTGYDCIEISIPGSKHVIETCLQHALSNGMQSAGPGAFCRQALANKRMHLDQAEAILSLTQASDADACEDALQRLRGALSQDIEALRQQCIELRARVEAGLDFLEEDDVRAYDIESMHKTLIEVHDVIQKWQRAAVSVGEHPVVCLVGLANAGKSALFKALSGSDALISDQAGTTRDFLQCDWDCNGRSIRLIDTAGWLEENNKSISDIDSEALKLGAQIVGHADLIVACSAPDAKLPEGIQARFAERPYVICATKQDLGQIDERAALSVSVNDHIGLPALRSYIAERLGLSASGEPRQQRHLQSVAAIVEKLQSHLPPDELLADDFRQIAEHLGDIIGITTTDDIMDVIFSRFCIGK